MQFFLVLIYFTLVSVNTAVTVNDFARVYFNYNLLFPLVLKNSKDYTAYEETWYR